MPRFRSIMAGGFPFSGPSGSGKSTIVRAITGERPAERGSVALDLGDGDMHVLARSFKDRSQTELAAVQMVPQDPATKPQSRALRGHPAFSRRQAGASSLVEERGEGAGLGAFGLGAFARRDQTPAPPLAFGWTGPARCHRPGPRHEPKVLVCDESTSALDPTTQKDILDTLNQLKRDEGLALVVVTHAERVARYTCEEEIAVPFEG